MILHFDIVVNSIEKSKKFYTKYFGFSEIDSGFIEGHCSKFISNNKYERFELCVLKHSEIGTNLELIEYESSYKNLSICPGITLALLSNNLNKDVKRIALLGLNPASEIYHITTQKGTYNIIFYKDPDGYLIEMLEIA